MEPIRVRGATNGVTDSSGSFFSPRFLTSSPHGVRLRRSSITLDSLGCLSLLEEGDKIARPHAFPSTDVGDENLIVYSKFQRPRAVLSNDDELPSETQEADYKKKDILTAPKAPLSPLDEPPHVSLSPLEELPKAPLSSFEELPSPLSPTEEPSKGLEKLPEAPSTPLEELSKASLSPNDEEPLSSLTGVPAASEAPTTSTKDDDESSVVSRSSVSLEDGKYSHSDEGTLKTANRGMASEPNLAHRNGNGGSTAIANEISRRVVKKHSCLPSNITNSVVKQKSVRSTAKGTPPPRKIVRPWY